MLYLNPDVAPLYPQQRQAVENYIKLDRLDVSNAVISMAGTAIRDACAMEDEKIHAETAKSGRESVGEHTLTAAAESASCQDEVMAHLNVILETHPDPLLHGEVLRLARGYVARRKFYSAYVRHCFKQNPWRFGELNSLQQEEMKAVGLTVQYLGFIRGHVGPIADWRKAI